MAAITTGRPASIIIITAGARRERATEQLPGRVLPTRAIGGDDDLEVIADSDIPSLVENLGGKEVATKK